MQDRFKYRVYDKRDNKLKDILGYTFSLGKRGNENIKSLF